DRGLVEDEGRPVVQEALALEDRDDPVRQPDAAGDLGDREGVGRRDDRAERERRGPREAEPGVGDDGDAGHRRADEPASEQRDRPQIRAQVAQRGEERRRVEERRQERDEDDVRRQDDRRQARDEAERDAARDEQNRHGDPQRGREREQRRERREQRQQLEVF